MLSRFHGKGEYPADSMVTWGEDGGRVLSSVAFAPSRGVEKALAWQALNAKEARVAALNKEGQAVALVWRPLPT